MPTVITSKYLGFYVPWLMAVAAANLEPVRPPMIVQFEGLELPLLQVGLAILGVLVARPLAPRRRQERGMLRQVLVTIAMLVVAVLWVSESQPRALFTFVVALGLGFSGYALVEAAGDEIVAGFRSAIQKVFATLGVRKNGDPEK